MPKIHNIEILGELISAKEPAFLQAFPQDTKYDEHIFDLLQRAYIDSRYNENYLVSTEELTEMVKRIKAFQDLTEKLCKGKIASFTQN